MARIARIKNLHIVLQTLASVCIPVALSVYGNNEDPLYWAECRKFLIKLPPHITVYLHGSVPPAYVPTIIAAHDLFFLPTGGENYGHAIIEALGAGTPVLISDRTPWRDCERWGYGWIKPLHDIPAYARCIEEFFHQPPNEILLQRQNARNYAILQAQRSSAIQDFRAILERALAHTSIKNREPNREFV